MKLGDYEFVFGCDPEVFLVRDGKPISAHDLIPGSKANPCPVPLGMMQPDGLAAEFGIKPVKTIQGWRSRIKKVMGTVEETVGKHGAQLLIKPSIDFDQKYYDALPDTAKELGCDPDYNAYTGQTNPPPTTEGKAFRSGGGHVHIGWTKDVDPKHPDHFEACVMLTKQLDLYLGVPSLVFDGDKRRRTLYGKAGAFRPKPYGMEYRTLSNAWLRDRSLMTFVFEQTEAAVRNLLEDDIPTYYNATNVERVINQNETALAQFMCRRYEFNVPPPPAHLKRKKEAT